MQFPEGLENTPFNFGTERGFKESIAQGQEVSKDYCANEGSKEIGIFVNTFRKNFTSL